MKTILQALTLVVLFTSYASAQTSLQCRTTGDWNNSDTYRAEFTIKIGARDPLSAYPTLQYKAEVDGWQDGEPGTISFKDASLMVTQNEVLVEAQVQDGDYATSIQVVIDRKTNLGRFASEDNSEEGTGLEADANGAGAVSIQCK